MKILALQELMAYFRHEKKRIIIAMLGIAIGVLSLVLMDSISGAMSGKIEAELGKMGGSLIMVLPGEIRSVGHRRIRLSKYTTLKPADVESIRKITLVRKASAVKQKGLPVHTSWNSSSLSVKGVEPCYTGLLDYRLRYGRPLVKKDLETFAKVAVIGSKIAEEFFHCNPLGKTIYLKGMPFKVVGVLAERGSFSNENFDEVILVPLTTHIRVLENVDYLDGAVVLARDRDSIRNTIRQIETILFKRHGRKDFTVSTYQELQSTTSKTLHLFSVLSRVVASIAFSVGTLGILAIMALSIYERILEIAIKRVAGARRKDIFLQFLTESMVLSVAGSAAGIVISLVLAVIIQLLARWPLFVPWKTAIISILLSITIGIVSGLYPAMKALDFEPKAILRMFEEG